MSTENEKDNLTKPSSTGVVFSSPQSVAPFVYKLFKQGVPRKKVEKMLKKCNFTFDVTHLDTEEIVKIIVNDIYMQKAYKGTEKTLLVYKKEIDFIKNQVNDANKLAALDIMSKHKKNITHLLFSFLVYSRYDDYESGWINYNRKRIFELAGLGKLDEKIKNDINNILVNNGLLSLRVIGTKNPILCYKLNWRLVDVLQDEDEEFEEIYLAPDSTSKNFISQIDLILD